MSARVVTAQGPVCAAVVGPYRVHFIHNVNQGIIRVKHLIIPFKGLQIIGDWLCDNKQRIKGEEAGR